MGAGALVLRTRSGAVLLDLKVSPAATRDAILEVYGARLKVAVRASPERGRANRAVVQLLESALSLPRGSVSIAAGAGSPSKTVAIEGVKADMLRTRIEGLLDEKRRRQ